MTGLSSPPWPRRFVAICALLVAATALLAFEPALRNELVVDDYAIVRGLPALPPAQWIPAALDPWWGQSGVRDWRPLARLTLLAQKGTMAMAGAEPLWPYYAFNILAHAAVSLLLFAGAIRWRIEPRAAFAGALLFAAHPIHAENVHQIVGRTELLAAGWMLAGLILWSFRGTESLHSLWQQPLAFALALGSKEHAILYPFYLALAVAAGRQGRRLEAKELRRLAALAAVLAAVAALYLREKARIAGGLAVSSDRTLFIENALLHFPPSTRLAGAFGSLGYAVLHLAWPASLVPSYTWHTLPFELGWKWPLAPLGAAIAAAMLAYAAAGFARGGRGWALSAGGLAGWLLTSNIPFAIGASPAPRLWYWPSVAGCLALGWLLVRACDRIPDRGRRLAFPLSATAATALLLAVSWRDAGSWRNPMSYAVSTLSVYPENWGSYTVMSWVLYRDRKFVEAVAAADQAIRIYPGDGRAWGMKGQAEMLMPDRQKEAEKDLRHSFDLFPYNPDVSDSLAILYHRQGRIDECKAMFMEADYYGVADPKTVADVLAGRYDSN